MSINTSFTSSLQSILVVSAIFLVALGSMLYISYFSGSERDEIIIARIKEVELSGAGPGPYDRVGSESVKVANSQAIEERRSVIDCENMVPPELRSPQFLGSIPNITAVKGDNVSIPCAAENLGVHRMAWLKLHSQTILTIHNHIISKNMRIGLSMDTQILETPCKNKTVETSIMLYVLHIANVQEKDEGIFMCQINTDPMKGQWGYLKVESESPKQSAASVAGSRSQTNANLTKLKI